MPSIALPGEVIPERRPFRAYGAALDVMYCRDPEVLLSGPAGTGKSRGCLEKLHLVAEKYPGARVLMVRKTRASLTESALVTWEEKVIPAGHPILRRTIQRRMRQAYSYPNGSEVVVGGMDNATKIMSTEWDIVYVQEGIELLEDDWEKLSTRLRNGVVPYQQIIGDTNPDAPKHWLKGREASGALRMMESRHEDNPTLWDARAGQWTPAGAVYISRLDALTGARKLRLRYGRWVQAEGVVYDGWDAAVHVIDRFPVAPTNPRGDPPPEWPRFWSVDFGYTNPFVWQAWAQDPDGRLYRYREIYMTQRLVADHAKTIRAATVGDPPPRAVICDHDAEDRATLRRELGLENVAAKKSISPGIQAMAVRLRPAGDGKPRMFFLRDSLVERDVALAEKHLPSCSEDEFDVYVWDLTDNRKKGELPVDKDNHGCFVAGTIIMTEYGGVAIERISAGHRVLTREGYRRVTAAGCTDHSAAVREVTFNDGRSLVGTGNHPVFKIGQGFVPLDTLRYNDAVIDERGMACGHAIQSSRDSNSVDSGTDGTRKPNAGRTAITSELSTQGENKAKGSIIATFGNRFTDLFRRVARSITSTSTPRIMIPLTSNVSPKATTKRAMSRMAARGVQSPIKHYSVQNREKRRPIGIAPRRAARGIGSTLKLLSSVSRNRLFVSAAGSVTLRKAMESTGSVPTPANQNPGEDPVSTWCSVSARRVDANSLATNTNRGYTAHRNARSMAGSVPRKERASTAEASSPFSRAKSRNSAPLTVLTNIEKESRASVYNLTVEGSHEYFANGILVHNCDTARYAAAHFDLKAGATSEPWTQKSKRRRGFA